MVRGLQIRAKTAKYQEITVISSFFNTTNL
jgi:hypothetical protein